MNNNPDNRLPPASDPEVENEYELIWHGQSRQVDVIHLIPHKLLMVAHDQPGQGKMRLRSGQILNSNENLTRRNGYNPDNPGEMNYQRYENAYDAIRGLAIIDQRYQELELPKLQAWQRDTQSLILFSMDLRQHKDLDPADLILEAMIGEMTALRDFFRDEEKVKARNTIAQMTLFDRLGRRNLGRLPPMGLAAKGAIGRRSRNVRHIGLHMKRRVVLLAEYLDQVCQLGERAALVATKALNCLAQPAYQHSRTRLAKMAAELDRQADILGMVYLRPFGPWSFDHSSDDLYEAAEQLNIGDWKASLLPLQRVRNSMFQMSLRRQMERLVFLLSRSVKLEAPWSIQAWIKAQKLLVGVRADITSINEEVAFRNPVLKKVRPNLNRALGVIASKEKGFLLKERQVFDLLKKACVSI